MPTEPTDQKVLADFAADALRFDLIKTAGVVAWADEMITNLDAAPPAWLVDLSLADPLDPHALIVALHAVPGSPNSAASVALLNGLVLREWRFGHLTIGRVRGIGWRLYRAEFESGDTGMLWGVIVECEGETLDQGLISQKKMREIIDRELGRFEESLLQLPEWA
jgi:hypothetical protein